MPQFGGASEKCTVCAKTVYLAEKIVVEDKDEKKTFHKQCLKCSHCKATLSLGNYASMNGVFYCKPHFKQLFATKGNYDEGFGKEKLTSKWAPNAPPAASTAGSFVPVEKEEIPAPKPSEKKDSPAAVAGRFGSSEKCEKCSKTVYATEKIVVEEKDGKKVYHKTCLRCAHCQNLLTLGNYASMNGVTYCKPHFKQLFAAKGNYDEGFGKEKHTTKWESTPTAGSPSSFVPVEKTDTPKESKHTAVNEVASKFKGMSASDKCTACGKTVYLTEKTVVEDKEDKKVFHKNCLRCKHCAVVLSLGNYASMGGVMYCKPHFKQLFASKGNYDEGFGKQKHTAKWIEQDGDQTTTTTSERDDESHEHHHEHEEGHEGHHKDHSFETTTSSSHHDDHEHEHEHEHKDGEHEHHHHEEGDEHHHEGEHHHHEGEHHHHEGEHHHHEGEHHHEHEHEHEGEHTHEEEAPADDE